MGQQLQMFDDGQRDKVLAILSKQDPEKKKMGRPLGSKNKPKNVESPYTEEDVVNQHFYHLKTVTHEAVKKDKGFTPKDIKEIYQVPLSLVYKAIHDGSLYAIQFGGEGRGARYIIPETELQQIEDHRDEVMTSFVFRSYMKKKGAIK